MKTKPSAMLYDVLKRISSISHIGLTFIGPNEKEINLPYSSLMKDVNCTRLKLQHLGLLKGDRIALLVPDNQQFITLFLAAVMSGIVPVPLHAVSTVGRIEESLRSALRLIRVAKTKLVVGTHKIINHCLVEKSLNETTCHVIDVQSEFKLDIRKDVSLIDIDFLLRSPLSKDLILQDVELAPDDICFIQFTSGSTSLPKGVMISHRNLSSNAYAMLFDTLKVNSDNDLGVSWLPLYHDMGLVGNVLAPLFFQIPVIYIPTSRFIRDPSIWMRIVSRFRATITFGSNFSFALAAKRVKPNTLNDLDLKCLRVLGCGSEPIDADNIRHFIDVFARAGLQANSIMPCYGMAEATLAITFHDIDKGLKTKRVDEENDTEFVCCGKTFPDHEINILGEKGELEGEGVIGEIIYRGPSVSVGYFENSKSTNETFYNGWLHTQDLGFIENDNLYVTGRIKDLIIINGRNYYPQDIERMIKNLNEILIREVVAFSISNYKTEDLVVVCEMRNRQEKSIQEVKSIIGNKVNSSIGIQAGDIVLVNPGAIPKTSSGKIKREEVRLLYKNEKLKIIEENSVAVE